MRARVNIPHQTMPKYRRRQAYALPDLSDNQPARANLQHKTRGASLNHSRRSTQALNSPSKPACAKALQTRPAFHLRSQLTACAIWWAARLPSVEHELEVLGVARRGAQNTMDAQARAYFSPQFLVILGGVTSNSWEMNLIIPPKTKN